MADNDGESSDAPDDGVGQRKPTAKQAVIVCLAVLGVVGAVAVVSSGDDEPDESEATPSTTTILPAGWEEIDEPDVLEPLGLGDRAGWDTAEGPAGEPSSFAVAGDVIVMATVGEGGGYVVADGTTGEERWRLAFDEPRDDLDGAELQQRGVDGLDVNTDRAPLPVSGAGEPVIAVPYERTRCEDGCPRGPDVTEVGIAAFALAGGDLLWSTPFDDAPSDESRAYPLVYDITAGGSTVVAAVDDQNGGPADLYAYDATDGSLRWSTGGLVPVAVAGNTVLVRPDPLDETHQWSLAALDVETGGQLWESGEDDTGSFAQQVVGDIVVVAELDRERGWQSSAMDVRTGDELVDFGPRTGPCATDGRTLVACAVNGPEQGTKRVATFRIEDGATGVSARPLPEGATVVGVVGGRIIVGGVEAETSSLDRSGTTLDAELPSPFHTANDTYAVFGCPPDPSADCSDYSVRRVD